MLNVHALASALPVVANLEARGLICKPIAGTPLANLVEASACDTEFAWDRGIYRSDSIDGKPTFRPDGDKYDVQIQYIASNTNQASSVTGYCEQDIALNEVADIAATAVVAHLAHARTVVVPTATMRPPRTATACAIENVSSTVMIFPFVRIVSGGFCCA